METISDRLRQDGKVKSPEEKFEESLKGISKSNANIYRKEVFRFAEWLKLNLDDLYKFGVECSTATDPGDRLRLLDNLAEYLRHVKETGVSGKSKNLKIKLGYGKMNTIKVGVFKFYAVNGINLKVDKSHPLNALLQKKETDKLKPTVDEVRELISVCPNFRVKAMIALSKDSGLRVSDVAVVKYSMVKEGINSPDGFGGFIIRTKKTKKKALPCFGPETTHYLKPHLAELEKTMGHPISDEDYVFPITKIKGGTKKQNGDKIESTTVSSIINDQIEKMGLKGKISATGLRYFFESQLENSKTLNMNIIKNIQGKGTGDSTGTYSKHDIDEILKLYKPNYHLLAVEGGDYAQQEKPDSLKIEDLSSTVKSMQTTIDKIWYMLDEAKKGASEENQKLKNRISDLETMYHKLHDETVQAFYVISMLPPEIQMEAVRKAKKSVNSEP